MSADKEHIILGYQPKHHSVDQIIVYLVYTFLFQISLHTKK